MDFDSGTQSLLSITCRSDFDFFIPYIIRIRKLSIDDEVKSLNVKTRTKMDKCLVIPFLETKKNLSIVNEFFIAINNLTEKRKNIKSFI